MSPQNPRRRRIAGESARRGVGEATGPESTRGEASTHAFEHDAPAPTEDAADDTSTVDEVAPPAPDTYDEEHEATDDPDPSEARQRSGARLTAPPRRTLRWLGPLLVVTVAAVVFAVVVGVQYLGERSDDAAFAEGREDAASAATTAAEAILGYDHETLQQDREAAEKVMTDDFGSEYDELYSGKYCDVLPEPNCTETGSFGEVVQQRKQSVDVAVTDVGTLECGDECGANEAKVLLFIDKTTTSGDGKGQPTGTQATFTMVEQDGEWLVDDIR